MSRLHFPVHVRVSELAGDSSHDSSGRTFRVYNAPPAAGLIT